MVDKQRPGDWIMTFSGIHFWPLDPRPEEINIEDIAHSLSMQCRWTGHTKYFYSVAEHSYLASLIVPPEQALQALLHDASEAYLSDIARPVKPFLNNYYSIEEKVQRVIYEKYGCALEMHESVKLADDTLLSTEADQLMPNPHEIYHFVPASQNIKLSCSHPFDAKADFLARARELGITV